MDLGPAKFKLRHSRKSSILQEFRDLHYTCMPLTWAVTGMRSEKNNGMSRYFAPGANRIIALKMLKIPLGAAAGRYLKMYF